MIISTSPKLYVKRRKCPYSNPMWASTSLPFLNPMSASYNSSLVAWLSLERQTPAQKSPVNPTQQFCCPAPRKQQVHSLKRSGPFSLKVKPYSFANPSGSQRKECTQSLLMGALTPTSPRQGFCEGQAHCQGGDRRQAKDSASSTKSTVWAPKPCCLLAPGLPPLTVTSAQGQDWQTFFLGSSQCP